MRSDRELLEDALNVLDKGQWIHPSSTLHNKIRARLSELENQTETELFTYTKGYEDGKQYVTHRVKRVLEGKPVPASIDCGLFEIKDKSTVTNLNLADGIYRLVAIREEI